MLFKKYILQLLNTFLIFYRFIELNLTFQLFLVDLHTFEVTCWIQILHDIFYQDLSEFDEFKIEPRYSNQFAFYFCLDLFAYFPQQIFSSLSFPSNFFSLLLLFLSFIDILKEKNYPLIITISIRMFRDLAIKCQYSKWLQIIFLFVLKWP